jgi:hypothetical protein
VPIAQHDEMIAKSSIKPWHVDADKAMFLSRGSSKTNCSLQALFQGILLVPNVSFHQ